MKIFRISVLSAIFIYGVYFIFTYRFEIPIYLNILFGILIFTLLFFVLSEYKKE